MQARPKILLVEDEPGLVLSLTDRLLSEGYQVEAESDGERAARVAGRDDFALILLDVMLPGRSGFDICRELRQKGVKTPILMLTARGETVDKILGLKLGADDYLTKPFDMLELLARVEALLRRSVDGAPDAAGTASFGEVSVDFRRAEVERAGEAVELSALELRLLRYFVDHPGEVLSRDELLDEVWGYDATPVTRTVDVHVASLRQKLEPIPSRPRHIQTVHGLGYKFLG
jgi:two-component system alkaline phosphatase synthesis response regulator PhoP